jgi:hypothetical protein
MRFFSGPSYGVRHKPEKVWVKNTLLRKKRGPDPPKKVGHFQNVLNLLEIFQQNEEISSRLRKFPVD